MSNNVKCEILTDNSISSSGACQTHHRAPVANTGSVIEEMSDCQWRTVIGQFGNVFPYRIVETELSVLLQQYERSSGELFRD